MNMEKKMLQAIMQQSEQFLKQLEDERKKLHTERKQLLELFNKLLKIVKSKFHSTFTFSTHKASAIAFPFNAYMPI